MLGRDWRSKGSKSHLAKVPCLSLSGALTQAIRNFAKSLESWLTNAMMNIPEEMVRIKVGIIISRAQE